MEQAKLEVTEFVEFLKAGDHFRKIGAKLPRGVLLSGPPGTGKTLLAKACAGQAGVSFFSVSGSQFVEMFVGLGASKVRDLFRQAKSEAPAIIFIDEIDAIGKKRESSFNEEKDVTLNQILVEMDGFSSDQTIVVMAATNRPDVLDVALKRPGRFDRLVEITLPQLKARQQIFLVHLKPLKINPDLTLEEIAKRLAELTPGFSGADIANLCNEAAILATRRKGESVTMKDFENASQRVLAGYQKTSLTNSKVKKRVAFHEAGHAVCGWFLPGGDPLVKVTIIPRSKGALGFAQYLPETLHLRTREDLIDRMSILMGGLTIEELFFNEFSSGASDDLQKIYGVARQMIASLGMGQSCYNLTIDDSGVLRKESESFQACMDEDIQSLISEARKNALHLLTQKKELVEALALLLLERETLNQKEIESILGPRPVFENTELKLTAEQG